MVPPSGGEDLGAPEQPHGLNEDAVKDVSEVSEGMGQWVAQAGNPRAAARWSAADLHIGEPDSEPVRRCIPASEAGSERDLEVMSRADFERRVLEGAQWLIVDGTIIEIGLLKDVHKGGVEVLASRTGLDITGIFRCFHANLTKMESLYDGGLTVMEHVRAKVHTYAVGVLDTFAQKPPLSSPKHRFWVESDEQDPYMDMVPSSIALTNSCATHLVAEVLQGVPKNSPQARAFWSIVGALAADAAAQPTQWNYKVPYFHEELRKQGRWAEPEFLRPSMNAWYKVPLGSHSAYGDMAVEVLHSLVACEGLAPRDVEERFAKRFGEGGEYGPLEGRPGDLPVLGAHRHNSLRTFLQRVNGGHHWPECGTPNAMEFPIRVIPVVALYAGQPEMLDRVSEVVRLLQDHPAVVTVGQAFARMLEAVILHGADGKDAIEKTCDDMTNPKRPRHLGFSVDGKVVEVIRAAYRQRGVALNDAVLSFGGGRFCTSQVA